MDLDEFEELVVRRQSCREFADRPVAKELVERICRIALLAPSACNAQPWELHAVVGEKCKEAAKGLQDLGMNKFASGAAALVAVVEGKSNISAKLGGRIKDNEFTRHDLGILTAHLVLAAESAGLGSCILGWRNEEKLRVSFGLKKDAKIAVVVALGFPAEGYAVREKKRKPLDETLKIL